MHGKVLSGAWSAKTNDVNQWIAGTFLQSKQIESVTTQGREDSDQWVKSYTLETSSTGNEWTPVDSGRVYTGNSDRNTKRVNYLPYVTVATSIRLRPVTWNGHISMRWAVDGCDYIGTSLKIHKKLYLHLFCNFVISL